MAIGLKLWQPDLYFHLNLKAHPINFIFYLISGALQLSQKYDLVLILKLAVIKDDPFNTVDLYCYLSP